VHIGFPLLWLFSATAYTNGKTVDKQNYGADFLFYWHSPCGTWLGAKAMEAAMRAKKEMIWKVFMVIATI
jgi:hypothetical protein